MKSEVLEEIGFSKGEVKVYFSLLELGETTIGPLSKKAGVTAAKVYPILDKLAKKGLSTHVIKSGTKYFQAASPNQIIEYLNEKTKKINEEKEEIKKLIPQLEAKKKLAENIQTAKVYQTYDGMKTLYNEILDLLAPGKEDFIAFTISDEEYQYKESEYFFQEYDTKRRELGIKVKLLAHTSQKKLMESMTKGDKNVIVKYLSYKMPTGVIIYGDKVATLVWGEIPTAFVISSKQTSEVYRKFFQDMWKIAKP
jgi:HTH-type transcriptional regulator, sugar sensing transcriptional regulator